MPGPREAQFETEFQQLRERYRRRLARDLEVLALRLQRARTAEPGLLEEAQSLAHRLKGTSGSFGLRESFEALERIESRISDLRERGADPLAAWDEIDRALVRARSGLDEEPPAVS